MMIQTINDHRVLGFDSLKLPDFNNVRPKDKKQLLLEVCKREHGFHKITFF